jgi:SAM-dependent methyltransferase
MIQNFFRVLWHKMLKRKTDFFLPYKYQKIEKYFGKICLDIGTGTGRFASFLHGKGKEIQQIDITDRVEEKINFKLFDGLTVPLEDHSVDTVVINFVLHHTDHQEQLLEEAKRVTKEYIIIAEDIIENKFDRLMGNLHLGLSPWSKSKIGFRRDREWCQLFESFELEVVHSLVIPRKVYPIYPVARKIYILQERG